MAAGCQVRGRDTLGASYLWNPPPQPAQLWMVCAGHAHGRACLSPEYINLGEVQLKMDGVLHVKIGANPDKLARNAIEVYELQVAPLTK